MYAVKQDINLLVNIKLTNNIGIMTGKLIAHIDSDEIVFDGHKWFINNIYQGDDASYVFDIQKEEFLIEEDKIGDYFIEV